MPNYLLTTSLSLIHLLDACRRASLSSAADALAFFPWLANSTCDAAVGTKTACSRLLPATGLVLMAGRKRAEASRSRPALGLGSCFDDVRVPVSIQREWRSSLFGSASALAGHGRRQGHSAEGANG